MSVIGILAALTIMAFPTTSVVALGFWARWVGRSPASPRWAAFLAYVLVGVAALLVAGGAAWGASAMYGGRGSAPGEKARMLAEAISATMYFGVLGFFVAVAGALWLGFCTWKWIPAARRRLLVGGEISLLVLAAAAIVLTGSPTR